MTERQAASTEREGPPAKGDEGLRQARGSLTPKGKSALSEVVASYRASVLSEASRLEAGQRGTARAEAEISARHIRDADEFIRKGYFRAPASRTFVTVQIVSHGMLISIGVLDNFLDVAWVQAAFPFAAVASMFLAYMNTRQEMR